MGDKWLNAFLKGFLIGAGIAVGFISATAVAVTVTATFSSGDTLTAASLNVLKTAIESIPDWAKGTNGVDATFTAGNVGIGTATPRESLETTGNLIVGSLAADDDDIIYFDDGTLEFLQWDDFVGRFQLSDDLELVNPTPELEFEDTTSGHADFDIFVDNSVLVIRGDALPNVDYLAITSTGNVGIANSAPVSTLQVGDTLDDGTTDLLQLDSLLGAPAAGTCTANNETGQVFLDVQSNVLRVCNARGGRGWDSIPLTD